MIDPRVASGLRDIPPSAMIPRERALATFRKTFADFGFVPIETPHIERMEVLTGKGAGSDEVLRQIYSVTNKGGEPGELALRFDLTVPFARFVAKHINELGKPFKRYAIGSVFRGERPAKGRFREFVQCDFDTVGTISPLSDAETAQVIHAALSAIGVPAFTIALNNRKILDGMLSGLGLTEKTGPILRSLDKLAKIGRDGVREELQGEAPNAGLSTDQADRVLDFVEQGRGGVEVLGRAEALLGSNPSAAEGIANLRTIFDLLDAAGVPSGRLKVDLGLARGLDYYTGIVYETTLDGWEKFGSVASGGRYDNLTRLFTDQPLPGVGASIGLDRLLALLDEAGWSKGPSTTVPVLLPNFPGATPPRCRLASRLRAAGIGAEVYPDAIQAGKQLQYGSTKGHKLAVIVGPSEQESLGPSTSATSSTREERKGHPLGRPGNGRRVRGPRLDPKGARTMSLSNARSSADRPIDPAAKGTADWLPDDHARLVGLETSLLRSVRPGRLRPPAHAGPGAGRAARAEEWRGDRGQAVRAGRPGGRTGLPPPRADGRDRPRLTRPPRNRPAAPLAGQPRRTRVSSREPGQASTGSANSARSASSGWATRASSPTPR